MGRHRQHLSNPRCTRRKLDRFLGELAKEPGGSLFIPAEPLFFPHRSRLPELAARHRLPAIYHARVFAEAGGLLAYGASLPDLWRRAQQAVKLARDAARQLKVESVERLKPRPVGARGGSTRRPSRGSRGERLWVHPSLAC
jgi:hypothetical protein